MKDQVIAQAAAEAGSAAAFGQMGLKTTLVGAGTISLGGWMGSLDTAVFGVIVAFLGLLVQVVSMIFTHRRASRKESRDIELHMATIEAMKHTTRSHE